MRRLLQDDYEEAGASVGIEFIGDMPQNVNVPATWRCKKCKRVLQIRLSNIRYHNTGCPRCNSVRVVTIDDYKDLGEDVGLKLAGGIPRRTIEHAAWETSSGDLVHYSYNQIKYRKFYFRNKYKGESNVGENGIGDKECDVQICM